MTEEGVIAAAPDAILITERSFERAGGAEGVRKLPGIALTPAGRNRRMVPVSDLYFQGFGPGIGKAVLVLTKKLYPDL
jgi:iron complex transport system substrate-binding protein